MVITNKRSVISLYSGSQDAFSHQIRIVLEEKGVAFDIMDVDSSMRAKEEVAECNPYGSVPTLIDRDLVLYKPEIITEYIDERFPHPPLLPVYPVLKARSRLMIYRISNDWYSLMDKILSPGVLEMNKQKFRQELKDSLLSASPIFAENVYFLSEEFSLIDCWLAPLLWRLPMMGIDVVSESNSIAAYQSKIFARQSFRASLTDAEKSISQLA
jgi:RNA polymerase-associated protein